MGARLSNNDMYMSESKYPDVKLHINGEWFSAADGRSLAVLNPADGSELGRVAHASPRELEMAVQASARGFNAWRRVSAADRAKVMRKAAVLVRERAERIAHLLTLEQGKPLFESRGEALAAADTIEWFADEGMRAYGRIIPSRTSPTLRQMVLKDPIGPVAAFTPWNFPVNQVVRKLAAALAAGCSIIVKAPEETPAAPAALIQAFIDAGIPPGVIGLVYGNPAEISEFLISHPVIRKVTFTGSTEVGKHLAAMAGRHMKRATMELGGHAPLIVAEDADLDMAVDAAWRAKFRNAGQVCISPTRFLVHKRVAGDFVDAFSARVKQLKLGDGLDESTQMGPLANARRVDAMAGFTDDAVGRGARLVAGGKRNGEKGMFWEPTILADVPLDSRVFNEEPFGPIAAFRAFETIEEAIGEANRLSYGLASYAFTRSLKTADLITTNLDVGMLWINTPAVPFPELFFGGVKDSGYGSEGGPEALDSFLQSRFVGVMNG